MAKRSRGCILLARSSAAPTNESSATRETMQSRNLSSCKPVSFFNRHSPISEVVSSNTLTLNAFLLLLPVPSRRLLLLLLRRRRRRRHFLLLVFEAVILLVAMRSPIYFCKNLLLLSSLSCSSLTASIRWKIVKSDSCSAFACL